MGPNQILGLDVGEKRTGIARGTMVAGLAEPLATVPADQIFDKLKVLIKEHSTQAIVVGLPRNLSGNETAQTQWVRDWVKNAKAKINLPFYWQDEALTSIQAKDLKPKVKNQVDEHALAAAIILQDFLDTSEQERAVC